MVVCLGEVVGEMLLAVEIKSVAHDEAEGGFFATCRLVPLKTSSLILTGSCPEFGGFRKRDTDFLITDGRWMVHENAEIGIYAEDRESEPE